MTKKELRAQEAENIRAAKVERYLDIEVNIRPTKGIDSGAHGKAAELLTTEYGSMKTRVGMMWQVDNILHFVDENGEVVAQGIERKTNGGEITGIIKALERGKDGIVIYSLDVCNANTKHARRYVSPRIMRFSTFVDLLNKCGAIRWGKTATNGNKVISIEPTKKDLYIALLGMLEFDDSHPMALTEII